MTKKIFAVIPVFILTLFSSCSDSVIEPFERVQYDTLSSWQYSDQFFFADTSYRNIFESYYSDSTSSDIQSLNANTIIPGEFELWVQGEIHYNARLAVCHVGLFEEPKTGYPDSLINPEFYAGRNFVGHFRKLYESEYYLNPESGLIGLKINIPQNFHIAISYKTQSGSKYGQFYHEVSLYDTVILKMIKSNILNPEIAPEIWDYKVKSIYSFNSQIPNYPMNFDFRIYYETEGIYNQFLLPDYSFIRVFRLDRFFEPVNKFDYVAGVTVIPEMNAVVIPFLEPFYRRIEKYTSNPEYYASQIYNSSKTVAAVSHQANKYKLIGEFK